MISNDKFKDVAMFVGNPLWGHMNMRIGVLYANNDNIRSDFARDYTRILHCR